MKYEVYTYRYKKDTGFIDERYWNRVRKFSIEVDGVAESIVEFPVNEWKQGIGMVVQDESFQRRRAYALCDYMNRMERQIDSLNLNVE